MTIFASAEAKKAYSKIGGALDNISDAYTYAAKAVSTVNDAVDVSSTTDKVSKYLKYTGKAQKIYSYATKIKDLLDETKRDGAILKLGLKISMDIAGKVLGKSLTTHPYYAYHKAMIDALADVLNASHNNKAAIESYRKAVSAANSKTVKVAFQKLDYGKVDLSAMTVQHRETFRTAGLAYDIARGMGSAAYLKSKIDEYGDKLPAAISDLEAWRAGWAGLSYDAMQLQIMTNNELNVAVEAMAKVKKLINQMLGGSSANVVAGYGAINSIEWEKYDLIVNQKKPDMLAMDPVQYATGNAERADAWAKAITEMCDFARGPDAVTESLYSRQLNKLNEILYNKFPRETVTD